MTTGNLLFLAMTLGVFTVFAAVLAYMSWQQSQMGPDTITTGVAAERPSEQPTGHPTGHPNGQSQGHALHV